MAGFGTLSPGEEVMTPEELAALQSGNALSKGWSMLGGIAMLPKRVIDTAAVAPAPGLRREDFTDIPADITPDPNSPLGGVGVQFGRIGWQPGDELIGQSLETAANVMGGTSLSAPARAGEAAIGAGPVGRMRMIENADLLKEIANQNRAKGFATGKPAAGWEFKRPDPAKGSFAEAALAARAGFKSDAGEAINDYLRAAPANPLMSADDWKFVDENVARGNPALGAGAADKRAATATAALDLSPEARAARAADQGFNIDAYHGTSADPFDAFKRRSNDIGIHFGTADQANDRLAYMGDRRPGDPHVYPVKLNVANPLRLPDLGGWGSENLFYGLRHLRTPDGASVFDPEQIRQAAFTSGNEAGRTAALRDLIKSKGYDGIVYRNTGETGGSEPFRQRLAEARAKMDEAFGQKKYSFTPEDQQHPAYQEWKRADQSYDRHREHNAQDSYIAFHPNQVRSQFAAFDPKNASKGMLLGAGAADKRGAAVLANDLFEHAPTPPPTPQMLIDAGQGAQDAYAALHGQAPEPVPAALPDTLQGTLTGTAGRDVPGGAGGGDPRISEAQAAATRWAGARQPLEGLPTKAMRIGDEYFVPGPIGKIHDVAEDYMRTHHPDRPYTPPTQYHALDPEHSKAIAQAFEAMPHTPNDPATKASYDALIKETHDQYNAIKKTGLKITPITPDMPDPYAANPRLAAKDVAENNHLYYFPTESGFGGGEVVYRGTRSGTGPRHNPGDMLGEGTYVANRKDYAENFGDKISEYRVDAKKILEPQDHPRLGGKRLSDWAKANGYDAIRSHVGPGSWQLNVLDPKILKSMSDHPMMRDTGEKIGDKPLLANDMFRIVHDYFGHLKQGHGFRAAGEDNAYRTHAAMYSDIARPAMTTETRGQNSWVNFGPHGEFNRTANAADTIYADQKVGLMPEWTMRDRGSPEPIIAYHGTPHSFDKFDLAKMGSGEGNQAYGHGLYFAGHEPVSEWYRHQLAARRDPLLPKYGLDAEDGANVGMQIAAHGGDVEAYKAKLQQHLDILRGQNDTSKAHRNEIARTEGKIGFLTDPERNPGHLYQVAIDHPPDRIADYDAPVSAQSPAVAAALKALYPDLPDTARRPVGQLYEELASKAGQRAASEAFKNAGIPALRYLDQASRAGGKGTHNYVTFDAPRILRKYAVPGMIGAGGFGALARPGEDR